MRNENPAKVREVVSGDEKEWCGVGMGGYTGTTVGFLYGMEEREKAGTGRGWLMGVTQVARTNLGRECIQTALSQGVSSNLQLGASHVMPVSQ